MALALDTSVMLATVLGSILFGAYACSGAIDHRCWLMRLPDLVLIRLHFQDCTRLYSLRRPSFWSFAGGGRSG